jgi:hypothetical protein
MNIFSTTRIKLTELYEDAMLFLESAYGNVGQYFSVASPMGQLLQIVLNIGRTILYYVEDSITELNIKTATRPNSVKGLAALTGHNSSRAMAARGSLRLSYNGQKIESYASVIAIPNYTTLVNTQNGLTYTVTLPSEEAVLNLTDVNNFIDVNVVQGVIEYQQGTGNGEPLQSFNFAVKNGTSIDNYFVNVYVDGVAWDVVDSILDMGFNQNACMVKTGQTGGIDVFFGSGYNGRIPRSGSTIMVEYLLTDGEAGNISTMQSTVLNQWKFTSVGYTLNNEQIDLGNVLNVAIKNQILFGTIDEPLYLTRLLAPHTSRSFVLANTTNYIYFLRKLNMFTVIDAIPGFATFEDQFTLDMYNKYTTQYELLSQEYNRLKMTTGVTSSQSIAKKAEMDSIYEQVTYYSKQIQEQQKDDNTIYLFLVPDINKRIPSGTNYFNAPISAFSLNDNEKIAILDLIEESGQRIITVDNQILTIQQPRFTLNMSLILWEGYNYDNIRENIISVTGEYFMNITRRDRIPVSDLVKLIEAVDGVDSVNVWFDADRNNFDIYRTFYGIDDYGDIILERYVNDAWNNKVPVRDIFPIFRGGFTNASGVFYEDSLNKSKLSSLNIQVRGYTNKSLNNTTNIAIVNNT